MRTPVVLSSAALASLAFVALVAAPQDFGGRQGGRGGPPMASPLIAALDMNRDSTISSAEIDNAPTALKTLDRNQDGQLAGAELMPAFGRGDREGGREGRAGMGGRAGEPGQTPATSPDELVSLLMAFDKNSDGQLDKSEVPERMQGIFDRADLNRDGMLTADEIRKSAAASAPPNARGGREGREGGRGAMLDRIVAALDTNKDGVISADEIANAPASLRTLDTNKDGQLTPDEYRQAGPGRSDVKTDDSSDERNC